MNTQLIHRLALDSSFVLPNVAHPTYTVLTHLPGILQGKERETLQRRALFLLS